jgi:hypothetical protein
VRQMLTTSRTSSVDLQEYDDVRQGRRGNRIRPCRGARAPPARWRLGPPSRAFSSGTTD